MILGRRAALFGLAAASMPVAPVLGAASAEPDRLAFKVLRNGSQIGTHVLSFRRAAGSLTIGIEVDIDFKLGPISLYKYKLRGTEIWGGGTLMSLSSKTDDDGKADFVEASRDDKGFWVSSSSGPRYLAPSESLPATHWNAAEMRGPWIDPQHGKLTRPTVAPARRTMVRLPNGRDVEADHFVLTGEVKMEVWYTPDGAWTYLKAPARDGSTISYDLMG